VRRLRGGARPRWLNPAMLSVVFVTACVMLAVSASFRDGPVRNDGARFWIDFIQITTDALESPAVVGTWRSDPAASGSFGGPSHCGLRSYGLSPAARDRLLRDIADGRAFGWRDAAGDAGSFEFSSDDRAFCALDRNLLTTIASRLEDVWGDGDNPRFRHEVSADFIIRGVIDRSSRQVVFWFAAYDDAGDENVCADQ